MRNTVTFSHSQWNFQQQLWMSGISVASSMISMLRRQLFARLEMDVSNTDSSNNEIFLMFLSTIPEIKECGQFKVNGYYARTIGNDDPYLEWRTNRSQNNVFLEADKLLVKQNGDSLFNKNLAPLPIGVVERRAAAPRIVSSPRDGGVFFTYKGRRFWTRIIQRQSLRGNGDVVNSDVIEIYTKGSSAEPFAMLIADAFSWFDSKEVSNNRRDVDILVPRDGRWDKYTSIQKRDIDTVYFPDGWNKSRFLSDLSNFFQNKTRYESLGIPHRRSYLFEGIPGSGKSSLSIALASVLNRDIALLTITKDITDDELRWLCNLNTVRPVVLLIEDIDAIDSSLQRSDKTGGDNKFTLSTLLQILDGVLSGEGRILVMTTNYPDRIDPSIIRSARIDVRIHFDYCTKTQMIGLWESLFPGEPAGWIDNIVHWPQFSVADAQSSIQPYINDPVLSCQSILNLIERKTDL